MVFVSEATNLDPAADTKSDPDAYLRDLAAETTRLVSATPAGVKADVGIIGGPGIDGSGFRVAFGTEAMNLGDPAIGFKGVMSTTSGPGGSWRSAAVSIRSSAPMAGSRR